VKRWFLPREPDLLGILRDQSAVTVEGMEAFVRWASGDLGAGEVVRDAEHRADDRRRALQQGLRATFSTPLDPEDLYELSERLDEVLNGAKNLVREADVLDLQPDDALAAMAGSTRDGTLALSEAFAALPDDAERATARADAAIKTSRTLEHQYREAMSGVLATPDPRVLFERRELYRRASRIADAVVRTAERVWYSVIKES